MIFITSGGRCTARAHGKGHRAEGRFQVSGLELQTRGLRRGDRSSKLKALEKRLEIKSAIHLLKSEIECFPTPNSNISALFAMPHA